MSGVQWIHIWLSLKSASLNSAPNQASLSGGLLLKLPDALLFISLIIVFHMPF